MKLGRVLGLLLLGLSLLWTACGGGPGMCSEGAGTGTGQNGGSGSGASSGGPGDNVCGTSTGGGGNNGGGGGGGASSASALVYYTSESSNTIQAAGLTGSVLASLSTTTPTPPVNAQMTFVNQKYLYAALGNAVEGFSLDRTTGVLTNVLGNLASYPAHGDLVTADPLGRFLFVSGTTTTINAFQINATTGTLTAAPGSPVTTRLLQIQELTVDASGSFLYASDGNTLIAIYSINPSTGALTEVTGSPVFLGVACIQADPAAEFLLATATCLGLGDPHMHVFSINTSTGLLTEISASPFATTASVFNFAVSPSGQFVYTFGYAAGSSSTVDPMEGFQMDPTTGALTAISGSPFASLPTVVNCFFDQSGALMLCSDTLRGSNLYVFAVDPKTGKPGLQATLPINTTNPIDFMYAITD
ncbi:MAG TPA: hypothetical protein VF133_04440 [Terriglobales bacterium]